MKCIYMVYIDFLTFHCIYSIISLFLEIKSNMNSSTDKNDISSLLFQLLSDQSPEEKCSTNLLKSVIKSRKKTNNNVQADDDKETNGQDMRNSLQQKMLN